MSFKISKEHFNEIAHTLRDSEGDNIFILGVDESYKNTGLSITYGNPFYKYETIDCMSLDSSICKDKNEYRVALMDTICKLLKEYKDEMNGCIGTYTVVERIRQFSKGFISMDYIKGMGALIAYIVEASCMFRIPTFSVDTRCWKSTVVGSSQKLLNSYNVAPEKFQTVEYVLKNGMKYLIFSELEEATGKKELKKKNPHNVFKSVSGRYIHVDDDKADSICISRFPFVAMEKGKDLDELLKLEQ